MSNGWTLFGDILWVLGLATLLASCSWGLYARALRQETCRATWGSPGLVRLLALGMMLTALGLGLRALPAWWLAGLWWLFALAFAAILLVSWRSRTPAS